MRFVCIYHPYVMFGLNLDIYQLAQLITFTVLTNLGKTKLTKVRLLIVVLNHKCKDKAFRATALRNCK